MGNALRKIDYKTFVVDGGLAQVKDRTTPTAPSTTGQASMSAAVRQRAADYNEYDPTIVAKLIVANKLAPFYEGKFDEKGDARSTRSDRASVITTESRRRKVVMQQQKKTKKKSIFSRESKEEKPSVVDKTWLTTQLLECPICLLVPDISIVYMLLISILLFSGIRGI